MVNAPVCGTGIRGFETHHPPHNAEVASEINSRCFCFYSNPPQIALDGRTSEADYFNVTQPRIGYNEIFE